MARRRKHDGAFRAVVPVRPNPSHRKEVEVPIVIARDERQAEVFVHMAVQMLGLQPKPTGTKITPIKEPKRVRVD